MEPIEYQTVINTKTGVIHYARPDHIMSEVPYPLCGNTVNNYPAGYPKSDKGYAHYKFTLEPATCPRCTNPNAESWFTEQIVPRLGWWAEQINKAQEIAKTHLCPFQLFAKKHGYDLEHDGLVFPESALDFCRHISQWRHPPTIGGVKSHVPHNVSVGYVGTTERRYSDRVALLKFMSVWSDALVIPWELIVKPWPEGSHSDIEIVTKTVRGDTRMGAKPPPPVHPYVKSMIKHMEETSIFGVFNRMMKNKNATGGLTFGLTATAGRKWG